VNKASRANKDLQVQMVPEDPKDHQDQQVLTVPMVLTVQTELKAQQEQQVRRVLMAWPV
jgi:hypothetical protein